MNRNTTHLLFDLDGTLIKMNDFGLELRFLLKAIPRFSKTFSPLKFRKALWTAAKKMQQDKNDRINFEYYIECLSQITGSSPAALERTAREAIEQDFGSLGDRFKPFPGARQTLELAQTLGYRLVVATNPVFPLAGVLTRMKHGGVADFPYEFISNSENMTTCKPNVEYYEELLLKLNVAPEQCLMIGNDPVKDLSASEVGIPTFLLDVPFVSPLDNSIKQDSRLDWFGDYSLLQEQLIKTKTLQTP